MDEKNPSHEPDRLAEAPEDSPEGIPGEAADSPTVPQQDFRDQLAALVRPDGLGQVAAKLSMMIAPAVIYAVIAQQRQKLLVALFAAVAGPTMYFGSRLVGQRYPALGKYAGAKGLAAMALALVALHVAPSKKPRTSSDKPAITDAKLFEEARPARKDKQARGSAQLPPTVVSDEPAASGTAKEKKKKRKNKAKKDSGNCFSEPCRFDEHGGVSCAVPRKWKLEVHREPQNIGGIDPATQERATLELWRGKASYLSGSKVIERGQKGTFGKVKFCLRRGVESPR